MDTNVLEKKPGNDDYIERLFFGIDANPNPRVTVKTIPLEERESLSAMAGIINETLNHRYGREEKQMIANAIAAWLYNRGRLLRDISNPDNPTPYLILDDGKAVAVDKASCDVRLAIADAGLNFTEGVFGWTISELQHRCLRDGTEVSLARFATWRNQKLYISSGPTKIVIVEQGEHAGDMCLTIAPNGHDGILFSSDGCLPAWTPTNTPLQIDALDAFLPILETPAETPTYAPEVQSRFATAWILAVLMQVRPLPILINVGQHASGKSTHAKAIIRLILGDGADLATTPCNPRDFTTCATSLAIYGLDNLDGPPEKWLPDLLAQTSTGGMVEERLLYTNGEMYKKQLVSAMLITTRTAAFASRPDILDRAVPLFFGSRTDFSKSERDILDEVIEKRDALMTFLAIKAIETKSAPVCDSSQHNRFTEFGNIVYGLWPDLAETMFDALNKAKRLSVSDDDTLLQAFLKYEGTGLRGNATQIINALDPNRNRIEFMGGGQRIARRLREIMPTLRIAGWSVSEGQGRGTALFEFVPPKKG